MLAEYIDKARSKAHCDIIDDEEPYYGEIPSLSGIWASGKSLEECRQQLIEVLEGWRLLRFRKELSVHELDNNPLEYP